MKRIDDCVEAIKLAYLSHTPIVWIVVQEKEVADQVATAFIKQHFGDCDSNSDSDSESMGDPYQLKSLRSVSAESLSRRISPAVYFEWIDSVERVTYNMFDLKGALKTYLDFFLHIKFEEGPRTRNEESHWGRNLVIIASPETPNLGWLNTYIETLYMSSLQDDEIKEIIKSFAKRNTLKIDAAFLDQLVINFRGISERQIESVLLKCLVSEYFDENAKGKILDKIRVLKRQMLEGFKGLKWINVNRNSLEVAGLGAITKWLSDRRAIFYDPERSVKQGFDIPKGLIITGVPGTGKSLMAKQTAKILNLPLIAMDLGDIQEGVVGKSEEHMAAALRMVDAMAPCVLWIDEIEKAFSGAESGQSDGGVMRRMFGKFLTWMQEKTSYCFVLATSNDISKLPPELFRSQRFDEKFFTFMPTVSECAEMFRANIIQHNAQYAAETGGMAKIFDSDLERKDYWEAVLNNIAENNRDEVQLDKKTGKWPEGRLPQKKLFTGADISSVVSALKFTILTARKNEGRDINSVIIKSEISSNLPKVLTDFMPYGQTNLKDIAKCFLTLSQNRFHSASSEGSIVSFDEFDEISGKMEYDQDKYGGGQTYNRTLYRCIVGAINALAKEKVHTSTNNADVREDAGNASAKEDAHTPQKRSIIGG